MFIMVRLSFGDIFLSGCDSLPSTYSPSASTAAGVDESSGVAADTLRWSTSSTSSSSTTSDV